MAGAALGPVGATLAVQVQLCLTLKEVLARAWAPLASGCNCVGARLCASGATFAWEAQHFMHLALDFAWQAHYFDSLGS